MTPTQSKGTAGPLTKEQFKAWRDGVNGRAVLSQDLNLGPISVGQLVSTIEDRDRILATAPDGVELAQMVVDASVNALTTESREFWARHSHMVSAARAILTRVDGAA